MQLLFQIIILEVQNNLVKQRNRTGSLLFMPLYKNSSIYPPWGREIHDCSPTQEQPGLLSSGSTQFSKHTAPKSCSRHLSCPLLHPRRSPGVCKAAAATEQGTFFLKCSFLLSLSTLVLSQGIKQVVCEHVIFIY